MILEPAYGISAHEADVLLPAYGGSPTEPGVLAPAYPIDIPPEPGEYSADYSSDYNI